jgi:hypothetical protein
MQNLNTHMDNTNQYIADIRRGVTKEGTYDQIREYALTKITSMQYRLKSAATDIKSKNNIAGNEKRIRGKVIAMATNLFNNMCITFDLFLYRSQPLSYYLNESYIEEFADVIFTYIYDDETEHGLERNLKIVIDKMYNEFSNSLN